VGTIPAVPAAEVLLLGEARSAGEARRFLAATLSGWNAPEYGDIAPLLLSELVSNAALHARTNMSVRIELNDGCLRMEVTDLSPRQPVVRHYSTEATTGRGLGLVDALAQRWGVRAQPGGGKTVWAEMVPDPAPLRRFDQDHVDLGAYPDLDDPTHEGGEPGGSLAMRRAA
jgi:anti-sigma regulatory factor (Ser/Thr protein kinase)